MNPPLVFHVEISFNKFSKLYMVIMNPPLVFRVEIFFHKAKKGEYFFKDRKQILCTIGIVDE